MFFIFGISSGKKRLDFNQTMICPNCGHFGRLEVYMTYMYFSLFFIPLRSFEGGMLTLDAFLSKKADRVVYWGTSGQRITDSYVFDSFSMAELIESGVLLFGKDITSRLKLPSYDELYADVKNYYEIIRKYVQKTDRSFYSFGWMLDISRCIYTLRTGKIIPKTEAAKWALENNLCTDPEVLKTALRVRRNPLEYKDDEQIFDYAETLAEPVQRYADVLEKELVKKWN